MSLIDEVNGFLTAVATGGATLDQEAARLQERVAAYIQTATGPWGDPAELRVSAETCVAAGAACSQIGRMLGLVGGTPGWSGPAATAFAAVSASHGHHALTAATAYQQCASGLNQFAAALEQGQSEAAAARALVANASRSPLDLPRLPAILLDAITRTDSAVAQVEIAADAVAPRIMAAADMAPAVAPMTVQGMWSAVLQWGQRVDANGRADPYGLSFWKGLGGWALNAGQGLVKFTPLYWIWQLSQNPAAVPGEFGQFAGGVANWVWQQTPPGMLVASIHGNYQALTDPQGYSDAQQAQLSAMVDGKDFLSGDLGGFFGHNAPAIAGAVLTGGDLALALDGSAADGIAGTVTSENLGGVDTATTQNLASVDSVMSSVLDHALEVTVRSDGTRLMSFVFPDDLGYIKQVAPIPGMDDVAIHGGPSSVGPSLTEGGYTPAQLAGSIRSGGWNGGNLRLLACNTGAPDATFAQRLADALGVQVRAPAGDLWVGSDGRILVTDASGNALPPSESWVTFFPHH